jgi:putative transposase
MREYRRAAHTVYSLHYHFVFIPKYRKPVLKGEVGTELRDLIREICRSQDIEILQGHIRPDHVHLLLSVPPHLAPSRVMQAIKGKTSHHLLMDHRKLRSEYVTAGLGLVHFGGQDWSTVAVAEWRGGVMT